MNKWPLGRYIRVLSWKLHGYHISESRMITEPKPEQGLFFSSSFYSLLMDGGGVGSHDGADFKLFMASTLKRADSWSKRAMNFSSKSRDFLPA